MTPKSFITKIYNSTATYLKIKKVLIKIASDYQQTKWLCGRPSIGQWEYAIRYHCSIEERMKFFFQPFTSWWIKSPISMIGQMSKKRDGFAYSADKGTILDGSQTLIEGRHSLT